MKYLQRLGKSLMLPVASLPVAAILMGIGYWIDPAGMGTNSVIAAVLIKAGGALIDNMAMIFAIGVAVGMSDDHDGTAALAGLISWLIITTMLSKESIALFQHIEDVSKVPAAYGNTKTQFIGIVCGLIGAFCYNRFKKTKLPEALSFFSGKRSVAIVTALTSLLASVVLFFLWPWVYDGLVSFGKVVMSTGPVGAGVYAFLNRLLIPFGLHHALNSVFWFNVAGIDDIAKFWGKNPEGVYGVTGMYMSGFFPMMMAGLPAAALAFCHTAKKNSKRVVYGLMLSAALSSFFTGVTEPLEFAFMFLAPGLYLVHAVLTGLTVFITALFPVRVGFNFSAGFVDWILSFHAPMAKNPILILPIGLVLGLIYYFVFRFLILTFRLRTPGRLEACENCKPAKAVPSRDDFTEMAEALLSGVGGKENVTAADHCITRLRLEVKEDGMVDENALKEAGALGVVRPGKNSVQIVIGAKVQFVAEEFKKLC